MIKTIVTRSANDKLYNIFKSFWRDDNIFIQKKELIFLRFNLKINFFCSYYNYSAVTYAAQSPPSTKKSVPVM